MHTTIAAAALATTALLALPGAASAEGLPGLRGPDHVGITVPDLEEAVTFFTEVIGCEAYYPLGPFADPSGTWMQDHLNFHPRAEIPAMRLVRCASGANLEVFQYAAPDQATTPPRNSDIGGHHVAFYVDDMEAAVAHLAANDVEVLGAPTTMTDGPSAGETWVYFLAPWGLQLELVSYPQGKAYEAAFEGRLWDPRNPSN
jgi:catechol 2,3-dioxygenase-like lactoylglutathione lyase family enzyme